MRILCAAAAAATCDAGARLLLWLGLLFDFVHVARHGGFVRISEAELSVLLKAFPNNSSKPPPRPRPGYVC